MGAQNQAVVTFNYLLAQGQFHLSTLLGSVFLVGFLLAWGMCYGFYFKSKVTIRKLNKQLKKHNANNDVSNEN